MKSYNIHGLKEDDTIDAHSYGYACQAYAPKWFDHKNPLHFCATSGSSPSNEWAGFHSEKQALEWVDKHCNNHQGFIDSFEYVNGRFYNIEDVVFTDDDGVTLKKDATPATVGELVTKLLEH